MALDLDLDRLKDAVRPYADWPLRLAFASVFIFHGTDKLSNGVDGFAEMMELSIGIAWLVALSELFAGVLVLAGGINFPGRDMVTRVGGALAVPVMAGAIIKVHWPRWSFTPTDDFPMGGMEFQTLMLAMGLFFVATAGHITERHGGPNLAKSASKEDRFRAEVSAVHRHAHWLLRLAFAGTFIYHGFGKFNDLEGFSEMMGLSQGLSFFVGYLEVSAGALILIGGSNHAFADHATRAAAILVIPVLIGAIAIAHAGRWTFVPADGFPMGGAEFQVALIATALFFLLRGRIATQG